MKKEGLLVSSVTNQMAHAGNMVGLQVKMQLMESKVQK